MTALVPDELRRPVAWGGMAAFLLLTFVLSWVPALLLRGVWQHGTGPWVTRLLAASVVYAGTMGWQPLLAALLVRRWFERADPLDQGLRGTSRRFAVAAVLLPLGVVAASTALAWLASWFTGAPSGAVLGVTEPRVGTAGASPGAALLLSAALLLTITVLYLQSLGEELGWRGYLLTRLVRELGPVRALVLHGAVWGLWYAPAFLLASPEVALGAARGAAFVITCTLLGVLLGWLRLASLSIMPSVIANAMLTTAAGLPFLLQNADVGLRGSVYGIAGWAPLAVTAAVLMSRRRRARIASSTWFLLGREATVPRQHLN